MYVQMYHPATEMFYKVWKKNKKAEDSFQCTMIREL